MSIVGFELALAQEELVKGVDRLKGSAKGSLDLSMRKHARKHMMQHGCFVETSQPF